MKVKKVIERWSLKIEIKVVKSSSFLKLHHATTRDAMMHMVSENELKNDILKKIISELEYTLNPQQLFVESLSMKIPNDYPKEAQDSYTKNKKALELLLGIRKNIIENIIKG